MDYDSVVADQAGKEVPRTDYGRRLADQEKGGRAIAWKLNPGEEMQTSLDVAKIYSFTKPGKYCVRVTRTIDSETPGKFSEQVVSSPVCFTLHD